MFDFLKAHRGAAHRSRGVWVLAVVAAFATALVTPVPARAASLTYSSAPDQLLLGTFWYWENYSYAGRWWTLNSTRTDSLYGSSNGTDFTRLSYEHLDMQDESIMYHDGYYWMITGNLNKYDSRIWPTISYSKDLVHWSTPENDGLINGNKYSSQGHNYNGIDVDTLPAHVWSGNGNDNCFDYVAPEWFVDTDGDVYILLCCGYWGGSHNDQTHDDMQPYLIKVKTLSVTAAPDISDDLTLRYPKDLTFYTDNAKRLNVASSSNNLIDGCIYKENGTYYMVIKRDGLENDVWTTTNIDDPNSWSRQAQCVTWGYEGPSLTKLNGTYYLYGDGVGGAKTLGTRVATSSSITSGWGAADWQHDNTKPVNFGGLTARHGTVINVTKGTNLDAWRTVANMMYDADTNAVQRLAGDTALDTMATIAENGGFATGGSVIVATRDGYWDALSAAGLAGMSESPVLLTDGKSLSAQTATELDNFKPSKVYIAGGTAAVSDTVQNQIKSTTGLDDAQIVRLAGDKATDTAVEIYKEGVGPTTPDAQTVWSNTCIVATSDSFQDALSIAPYAYAKHAPIFLAESGSHVLSQKVLDAIESGGFTNVEIVGGSAAVSDDVLGQLSGIRINSGNVNRLWGNNAYDTSLAIAKWELDNGMTTVSMGIATGEGYWDALAGAALCGKESAILVLANDEPDCYGRMTTINNFAKGRISGGKVSKVYAFGGSAVVSHYLFNLLAGGFPS